MNKLQIDTLLVLIGNLGEHWYFLPVDAPEWLLPAYFHQN